MKGFIEIRNEFGNRILINVRHIEEVREHSFNDTCTIYLAFVTPNAMDQDYFEVKQSYDKIVALIKGAMV